MGETLTVVKLAVTAIGNPLGNESNSKGDTVDDNSR